MTNLVLQSFGRENEYKRAILTVLSFYVYNSLPIQDTRVILFTDKPDYFKDYLAGLPVDFVLLTPAKIKEMRGQIDFLHRMKIALIEEAFGMIDGNMLYADSDTFFTADPIPLARQLSPQKSFMHLWEYEFESLRNQELPAGQTFVDFLKLIENNTFKLADGSEIKVSATDSSWNAGVMFFHPSHVRFIPDVYTLTDQFYPGSLNHASEQYAFSIMLQKNTNIVPCDSVIYHFWYRTKKQIIDLLLQNLFNEAWGKKSLTEKLQEIRNWTERLPTYFEDHILTIKDNAIQNFNLGNYSAGYKHTANVLLRELFSDKSFLKDVLYFTKKKLF